MAAILFRSVVSIASVMALTVVLSRVVTVNATTAGFGYLVLVLLIASTWGFIESACASVAATLCFNFFFFPPVGTFTIADPDNWVALFSFLTTSLVASRLSTTAKERARDAIDRQRDIERLYSFSRAILLIDAGPEFPKQLVAKVAEIFDLRAVVLFDRRPGEFHRGGPADFEGLDEQLRDAALNGTSYSDPEKSRTITAVRLGSEPIASLALQGSTMPDSVLQGIANLVAIGLERARAQDLAHQMAVAKQSEQLRTTLIDAMAHEFKTPLTSIRAATTSLLSNPEQPAEIRTELLRIADEEAEHLRILIDDSIEMARLDTASIDVQLERCSLVQVVEEVVASMRKEIENRSVDIVGDENSPAILIDQRLIKLALKQLLDNALKYSAPESPVSIAVGPADENTAAISVTDRGVGIPPADQEHIFERFWRSPSIKKQIPGSGLGLSIVQGIAKAHNGDLSVTSRQGETTFRLTLPMQGEMVERGPHSRR